MMDCLQKLLGEGTGVSHWQGITCGAWRNSTRDRFWGTVYCTNTFILRCIVLTLYCTVLYIYLLYCTVLYWHCIALYYAYTYCIALHCTDIVLNGITQILIVFYWYLLYCMYRYQWYNKDTNCNVNILTVFCCIVIGILLNSIKQILRALYWYLLD